MSFFGYATIVMFALFVVGLIVAAVIENIMNAKKKNGEDDNAKKLKKIRTIIALCSLGCLILGVVFIFADHNVSMNERKDYADKIINSAVEDAANSIYDKYGTID